MQQPFITKAGKLHELLGTEQDDIIAINCQQNNLCTFRVNEQEVELTVDKVHIADFQIHAKSGNDKIDIIVAEPTIFPSINVYPDSGINQIYSALTKPYSRAVLNLAEGYNLLVFPESGSNIYVKGFRNSPHNKIKVITTNVSAATIFCEQDYGDSNSNTLFFKKNTAAEQKELAVIYNTLTPDEYSKYAELILLQLEGDAIPAHLEDWLYVLNEPLDLMTALQNNDAIIFAEA